MAARDIRHLLLYGTLCAGEPGHARLGLPDALELLGRRTVAGTLYDLGEYPGIVLGGGTTTGELYGIRDASVLAKLDDYEGFDSRRPQCSLFVRTTVPVLRFAQAPAPQVEAWIYVFNGVVAGRARIPSGSWRAHRLRRT